MYRVQSEKLATITKLQLLACNLVERVHDAIYVIPRREDIHLEEYAIDIAYSMKTLIDKSSKIPIKQQDLHLKLQELKNQEISIDQEIKLTLQQAKEFQNKLSHKMINT